MLRRQICTRRRLRYHRTRRCCPPRSMSSYPHPHQLAVAASRWRPLLYIHCRTPEWNSGCRLRPSVRWVDSYKNDRTEGTAIHGNHGRHLRSCRLRRPRRKSRPVRNTWFEELLEGALGIILAGTTLAEAKLESIAAIEMIASALGLSISRSRSRTRKGGLNTSNKKFGSAWESNSSSRGTQEARRREFVGGMMQSTCNMASSALIVPPTALHILTEKSYIPTRLVILLIGGANRSCSLSSQTVRKAWSFHSGGKYIWRGNH